MLPIFLAGCAPHYGEASDIPEGYSLFFEDEFEGNALNSDYWTPETGNNNGWGNGEVEYYQGENAVVRDGELHIIAKKESVDEFEYTSARIKTADKVKFKNGYVEAKIKLPNVKGMWPAFWMMPNDAIYGNWPDSGEIDIMEANGKYKDRTSAALHYSIAHRDTYKVASNIAGREVQFDNTEYHLYKLDWNEEMITFMVDDRSILEVPQRTWQTPAVSKTDNPVAPYDQDFFLIFNLAISGNYVNGDMPPRDFTECEMVGDYVRVYTAQE